jgi:ethanolamine utilization protein EutA (predicted chaperonin)
MDEIVASAIIGNAKAVHIGSLARQTIIDAGAEHLGFDGYFIFEADDSLPTHPITVLAKASSLEAAFQIADLWSRHAKAA